jgi:hypothetical protein
MSNAISPLRRIAVTLAMTGVAAFSAVAIAPAAFADDAVAVQPAPAVTDPAATPAPAVVPAPAPAADPATPAVVYDKNGKPIKAPKVCTAKDLADTAKKVADATKKAAPVLQLAAKSHDAADLVRAQEPKMTLSQAKLAELVAGGLDMVGNKLEAQAKASIDAAGQMDCIILVNPAGRF